MLRMSVDLKETTVLLYSWDDETYSIHCCADLHDDGWRSTEVWTRHYDNITDAALAMPTGTEAYVPYTTKEQRV